MVAGAGNLEQVRPGLTGAPKPLRPKLFADRTRKKLLRASFPLRHAARMAVPTVDLTLRVRRFPHAEREVYDLLPLA